MSGELDPITIRARRVLLDALEALAGQRQAIVLVGAQAIYLHTGEADLAVSPFTQDADLALNPATLCSLPVLAEAMQAAGFITGRVKPRLLRLGIEAALLRLTYTYHTGYHMYMKTYDTKPIRWTLYADPALIELFRQLATLHRRSLNSELIWALEQYAKAEQRKEQQDADQESV